MDPESSASGANKHALAAVLLMTASMMTLDAYSTFQSSPWTIENFGADEAKTKACKEYLTHAVVYSSVYAVASSVVAESAWPVVGATVANAYLIWLYARAMRRGREAGSKDWANGNG